LPSLVRQSRGDGLGRGRFVLTVAAVQRRR
jgi:hypothetical protein